MWGALWGAAWAVTALVWTVALTVTDLRDRRLPDALTLPAAALVWGRCLITGHPWALAGALAWWGLCVLPGRISGRLRIGGGDAKLALSLGAVTVAVGGPLGWWLAVTASSLVTLGFAVLPGGTVGHGRGALPHGPGMLAGSWLAVLLTM